MLTFVNLRGVLTRTHCGLSNFKTEREQKSPF